MKSTEEKEKINIINKFKNIILDGIIINNKIIDITTKNYEKILKNDELENVNFCICYYCSGHNNEKKILFKAFKNFMELKNHCQNNHNSKLKNCIINVTLNQNYVAIESKNQQLYIIKLDDMLDGDKKDFLEKNKDNNK